MADIETLPRESPPPASGLHAGGEALHLTSELKEEGVFSSLLSSLREVFAPAKLPPLVLESKPIAVPDPMAVKRSPTSTAIAVGLHAAVFLIIAFFIARQVIITKPVQKQVAEITLPPPPPIMPRQERMGGGGGQHDLAPVTQGHLPKPSPQPLVPPKAPPTEAPKLAVEPTVNIQKDLKMDSSAPNLGVPNSSLHGFSMGNGNGTGIGSGNGNGVGPGSGGNMGGGPMHIGGAIRPPSVSYSVDPEFSEEARKAKFSGNVQVYLWVDEQGNPSHVKVVRGVGMGLDEKAVEAVRQYKFHPAMLNGKPVKVDLYIEVNFQIF